jgi:hypothetical protein
MARKKLTCKYCGTPTRPKNEVRTREIPHENIKAPCCQSCRRAIRVCGSVEAMHEHTAKVFWHMFDKGLL